MTDEPTNLPAVIESETAAQPIDFTVVARSPQQMAEAQKSLIKWASQKIEAEQELETEAKAQLAIAVTRKWSQVAWKRRVKLSGKRITFYQKIRAALEAGYYIVPPFPLDIFAVRTSRSAPLWRSEDNKRDLTASPQLLPEGKGRYVASQLEVTENYRYAKDAQGKVDYSNVTSTWYNSRGFQEVDFPFKLAKAEVMEETGNAFALKIFDQFGVLPKAPAAAVSVRRDPIICGQILAPHKNREPVTFFVAWWLDTRTL